MLLLNLFNFIVCLVLVRKYCMGEMCEDICNVEFVIVFYM